MKRAVQVVAVAGSVAYVGLSACRLSVEGLGSNAGPADVVTLDVTASADVTTTDGGGTDAPMAAEVTPPGPDGGDSAADAGAVDASLCAQRCTMEGGICEPGADGGEQCSVYCNTTNPCTAVVCPPGIPCFVDCTGENACSGGIDCSGASSCSIACGASSNCGTISCGGDDCRILCQTVNGCTGNIECTAVQSCDIQCAAAGTCAGTITSGAQNTMVACSQPGTCAGTIVCGGSQCSVDCDTPTSCANGECCDASTCNPETAKMCP